MKRLVFFGILSILPAALAAPADLNGPWTKTTSSDPHNLTLFFQQGEEIHAIGFSVVLGGKAAWHAVGTLLGNRLRMRYRHSSEALPQGWEPEGSMELMLSEDANKLTGTSTAASGGWSGPTEFIRVGSGR
ncbi:MAG: hypothetical protein ACOWWM_16690 [Desulfobacterales bacterium]